ncbi:hypothetical protein RDABS01_039256 [Bienertia sinuspersici]
MVNGIIAPCIGEACAPYAYETLQKKLEELKSKLIEGTKLLKSLEKQENGSAILNNDAIKWKNDAKEILSKVEINIIKLERHIEATCICGCLPNCRKRRTAKRSILQELQKVEELITRHKPVVKGYRLPENALVQMTRSSDIQEIWYWISQREDVKVVCIHGIPGVGKTAVAEAVCNKALLDNHELFSYVIWVEAYYEITLNNLQEKIMRFLSIEPAPTDDDNDRARKIRDEFVRRKENFSLRDIGIPEEEAEADGVVFSSCHLLKLQELVLIDLPELESIYPGQQRLKWPAFYRFTVWNCNQLKRLPLIFNGKYPKVIKLKGKSFKLNDYLHFEHEEARVPEDIVSFVRYTILKQFLC